MSGAGLAVKEMSIDIVFGKIAQEEIPHLVVRYFTNVATLSAQFGHTMNRIGCRSAGLNDSVEIFCFFFYF